MVSRQLRILLDTNVIIAAVFSPEGGSGEILEVCRLGLVELYLTPGIITEASQKFDQKFPAFSSQFLRMIKEIRPIIVPDPSLTEIKRAGRAIDKDDAPILATGIKAPIDYLITLDKKHFRTKKVQQAVNFKVISPREFLRIFN